MYRAAKEQDEPKLVIRQLKAPRPGQDERRLELSGWCGPVDTIKWGGVSQRNSIRPYPGSGDSAVFLDGPEQGLTEFQFDWKSRQMDGTQARIGKSLFDLDPIFTADDLVDILESMVSDQTLVEVTFRDRVRVGVLTEVVPVEGMESEFTATLSFQGTSSPHWKTPKLPSTLQPPSLYEAMKAQWDAAIASALAPITVARRAVENADMAIDDVNATFRRFGAIATEVRQTGATAVQVYRGVGECLASIVTQTDSLLTAFAAPWPALAQTDDPASQMRARAYGGRLAAGARKARARAALERGYYRSVERSEILGLHVVAEGETIWGIAWQWYGDTTAWRLIAQRNTLPSTKLRAGTRLVIPRRPANA